MKPQTPQNNHQQSAGKFVRLSAKRLEVKRLDLALDDNTTAWIEVQLLKVTRGTIEELEKRVLEYAEGPESVNVEESLLRAVSFMIHRWSFVDSRQEIVDSLTPYEDSIVRELGQNWANELRVVSLAEWLADGEPEDTYSNDLCYIPVCVTSLKGLFPNFGQSDYFLKMYQRIQQLAENPTPSAGETRS